MKKFEYDPLIMDNGTKAIEVFNDLVTLQAGILDFVEKYEGQIDTLCKNMSKEALEPFYMALIIIPEMIADLAPTVRKELSKDKEAL